MLFIHILNLNYFHFDLGNVDVTLSSKHFKYLLAFKKNNIYLIILIITKKITTEGIFIGVMFMCFVFKDL